jgi:hypothetical protein
MKRVPLREIAHSRTGEKGDDVQLSVIAYREDEYPVLRDQVTVEAVQSIYGPILESTIDRYEVPSIGALNFVLHNALSGGRSRTLAFEESGKALSSLILSLLIEVSDDYVGRSEVVSERRLSGGRIGGL